MQYIEMSIDEAMKRCKKNTKVLVAVQNLEEDDSDVVFTTKKRCEYDKIFDDVETVAALCDDLVKQLRLFTERQNIYNVKPKGMQKIILLRE